MDDYFPSLVESNSGTTLHWRNLICQESDEDYFHVYMYMEDDDGIASMDLQYDLNLPEAERSTVPIA